MKKVMVVAGGSGGHVFPGLAVSHCLINKGYKVVWLGTENHIESKLVPKHGIDIKFIRIQGWRGKKIYTKFIVLLYIFFSIYQSLKIIKYWNPDVVLGMGGYVSGPGGLAAWICGIPLIIHEQNRVMGLANRYLSFFANKVLQGFPNTINCGITVGNPLRCTILSIPDPIQRWKNRAGPIRVLVIGGSQGSTIFNSIIPEIAEQLFGKLIIWHQVGTNSIKSTIRNYHKIKQYNYKIESFIDDIDRAYEWADILISRSGALTVSEVSYIGLPTIFVPFEHHVDCQQFWNALPLVQIGAAKIIEQKKFTVKYVSIILQSLDRTRLLHMACRARILSIPNATQLVTQVITQYL